MFISAGFAKGRGEARRGNSPPSLKKQQRRSQGALGSSGAQEKPKTPIRKEGGEVEGRTYKK